MIKDAEKVECKGKKEIIELQELEVFRKCRIDELPQLFSVLKVK